MKRTKKIIFSAVLMTASAIGVNAQTTGNVTLEADIQNASTLTINTNTATLTYATSANYANGVTVNQNASLNVQSNQAYSVTVYAASDLTYLTNTIPVSDVTVTASPVGSSTNITCTAQAIPTGVGNAAQIITSTDPTISKDYNVSYATSANNPNFIGKPAGTYSTTLTYTLTNP